MHFICKFCLIEFIIYLFIHVANTIRLKHKDLQRLLKSYQDAIPHFIIEQFAVDAWYYFVVGCLLPSVSVLYYVKHNIDIIVLW